MPAIDLRGSAAIQAKILALGTRSGRRVQAALLAGARVLMEEADKIVPVDTGWLKNSGKIRVQGTGWNTVVSVGYGTIGTRAADYAVYVHEDSTKRHGQTYNVHYASDIAAGIRRKRRGVEQYNFLRYPLYFKLSQIRQAVEQRILR